MVTQRTIKFIKNFIFFVLRLLKKMKINFVIYRELQLPLLLSIYFYGINLYT